MKMLIHLSIFLFSLTVYAQKTPGVLTAPSATAPFTDYDKMPDLVVSRIWFSGAAQDHTDGSRTIKVTVVISNRGVSKAGRFKTAIALVLNDGHTENIPFTVPGQTDSRFPMTTSSLPASQQISFEGELKISPSLLPLIQPRMVSILTTADSIVGESLPSTGRVNERNESNNTLRSDLAITLILRDGP